MDRARILCGVVIISATVLLITYSAVGPVVTQQLQHGQQPGYNHIIIQQVFAKDPGPEVLTNSGHRGREKSSQESNGPQNMIAKSVHPKQRHGKKPIAEKALFKGRGTVNPGLSRPASVPQRSWEPTDGHDHGCLVEKPWFEAREFSETYLVVFGKPIMRAQRNVAASQGWKVKHIPRDSPEGLSELQKLVSPERFLVVFPRSMAFRYKLLRNLVNSTNALIGNIGNAGGVTAYKQAELNSFRRYFHSFGCSLENTGFMPRSFFIDDPKECKQFFSYIKKWPKSAWFLKPSHGNQARGITVHTNLTYFYKEYATCTKKSDSIVQEYVTNPLLLEKRKFDIRAYILIAKTSPHYLVFYHDGYLKRSVKPFDLHDTRSDVHISNTRVQTHQEGYVEDDHLWGFHDLQNYLRQHRPKDGKDAVATKIVPAIQKIGLTLAHTCEFLGTTTCMRVCALWHS